MNLDEVIGEISESNGGNTILNLLGKRISQPSEPANSHANRRIVSFDVACVDVLWIGIAGYGVLLAGQAHSGAVTLLALGIIAMNLDQLRVVDIVSKRLIYSFDVHLQAIASKLNAIRKTARKILNEITCAARPSPP